MAIVYVALAATNELYIIPSKTQAIVPVSLSHIRI